MPTLHGGCQCGAIRYTLTGATHGSICHCRMCQKAVGGPFAALATIDRADFAWTRGTPARFASSNLATRGFCAACGTPLTYENMVDPARMDITIGSLDTPAAVPPQDQYGIEGRLPWFESLPALPGRATEEKYADVISRQHPDHG